MKAKFTDSEFREAYKYAKGMYSCDDKRYHTIYHVDNMLAMAKHYLIEFQNLYRQGQKLSDRELFSLRMSILFHDCVYDPESTTNEEDSSDEADVFMKMNGYDREFRKEVCNSIISTKPGIEQNTDMEKFIHDLDWSYFITYEEILDAEKKIFKEFKDSGFILREVFKGRLQFYIEMDKSDKIFTSVFEKYNQIAKSNISQRIIKYEYSV